MRQNAFLLLTLLLISVGLLGATGCGNKAQNMSDSQVSAHLKQGFDDKKVDMSKLTPEMRAQAQKYMGGSAPSKDAGSKGGNVPPRAN